MQYTTKCSIIIVMQWFDSSIKVISYRMICEGKQEAHHQVGLGETRAA